MSRELTGADGARCARCLDVAGALAGLVLLGRYFALAALAIAISDGRPVLTSEANRKERSTVSDPQVPYDAGAAAAIFPHCRGRHRVTRVGAWLRAFKIDEMHSWSTSFKAI